MSLGLVGRKVGMTRVFAEDGVSIPVTVLDVSNNRVTQIKTPDVDGYAAIQVTFGKRRASRVNKAAAGHLAKAGVEAGHVLKEFRLADEQLASYKAGDVISVEIFTVGQKVDVTGVSIGKGFAGTIKRHNFGSQRATHGNSRSHNVPGSIGMAQDPGRVFPGKRMSGHLGAVRATVQSLEVVRVDAERGLLLVKGAVPGHDGGDVVVRPAVKAK
ncbi:MULTISPECIES: 50S ribosomal protein L3 [Niveibacterium]|uniref:Large ribosomal subunit protein uL3 n=1 Tax=Niveibacterium microcysteis TaxID=2811415 RepID=A0ABX7M966_9RHOO|nr:MULTISPECIES: 50S ribosomal protein L3 [Niveibacterium]QSI77703.1 50S ribosomal protein L3 [Niveibacterium microcysteis]